MKVACFIQVLLLLCLFLAQVFGFVIVSAQPPSEPMSACGALMESDEVRASSCSLTDRAWIFARLKKKNVSAPDGWLRWNLTAAKKHHAADPLVRSPGPRRLEKNKKKTRRARWKSRGLRLGSVLLGFSRPSRSAASLCPCEKSSPQPDCKCCLDRLNGKSCRREKTSALAQTARE